MNYRQIVVIIELILFLNSSCTENTLEFQKTTVSGKVENITDSSNYKFVEIYIYEPFILEPTMKKGNLDSEGGFHIEFEQLYPHEIFIKFKQLWSVYVFPGDSINLSIDANVLEVPVNLFSKRYDYVYLTGDSKKFNKDYIRFQKEYYDSMYNFSVEKDSIMHLDPNEYKSHIERRTNDYKLFIEGFNKKNETSLKFRKWGDIWIKSNVLNDLMRYRWVYPFYTKFSSYERDTFRLPNEYFSFLTEENCFNEDFMVTIEYYQFLWEYFGFMYEYMLPQELIHQQRKLRDSKDYVASRNITKLFIMSNTSDFAQKALITSFYLQLLSWKEIHVFEKLYDPRLVGRDDYCQLIETKYNSFVENANNPKFLLDTHLGIVSENSTNELLNSLRVKYPDKVLYIDFWAPWCGPCMDEMPFSRDIQKHFKGKDVAFIFLASRCSEYSWKGTISEQSLTGEHYLLTDEQYSNLSNRFNFAGIPQYLIVDKNGIVVNDNAPRPSNKDSLIVLLNSVLSGQNYP